MRTVRSPLGRIVHVLRDEQPGKAWCGAPMHTNRAGRPVPVDATVPLGTTEAGEPLQWCGKCLGTMAVDQGRSAWLAAAVVQGAP